MEYLEKKSLLEKIEYLKVKYSRYRSESNARFDGNSEYWTGVLGCLNEVHAIIDSMEGYFVIH